MHRTFVIFLWSASAWLTVGAARLSATVHSAPGCPFGGLSWGVTFPFGRCVALGESSSIRLDLTHPRACDTGGDCVARSYADSLCSPSTAMGVATVPLNQRCTTIRLGSANLTVQAWCRGAIDIDTLDLSRSLGSSLDAPGTLPGSPCSAHFLFLVYVCCLAAVAVAVLGIRRPYATCSGLRAKIDGWLRRLDRLRHVEEHLPGP